MAQLESSDFNCPLSLYCCALTRVEAIRQALELKHRREQRRLHFARRKAERERMIFNTRKNPQPGEDVTNT